MASQSISKREEFSWKWSEQNYWVICRDRDRTPEGFWGGRVCASNLLHVPAAIFGGLFTLLFIVHLTLAVIHRRRICWSIVTAALLSALGYWMKLENALRVRNGRYEPSGGLYDKVGDSLFLGYYCCVFIAVFFLNIYIYTLLHRLRTSFSPSSPRPRTKLWSLICLEISAMALLLAGICMQVFYGYADGLGETNAIILFCGFILQILNYGVFSGLLVEFWLSARAHERTARLENEQRNVRSGIESGNATMEQSGSGKGYKWMVLALVVSMMILTVRALYYALNAALPGIFFPGAYFYDYLDASNPKYGEWMFKFWEGGQYGLDATMVFLVMAILALPWVHPGKVLPKTKGWSMRRRGGEGFVL